MFSLEEMKTHNSFVCHKKIMECLSLTTINLAFDRSNSLPSPALQRCCDGCKKSECGDNLCPLGLHRLSRAADSSLPCVSDYVHGHSDRESWNDSNHQV